MRRTLVIGWLLALAVAQGSVAFAQEKKDAAPAPAPPPPPPLAFKVGDEAPDFTLTDDNGNKVTLSDFRGKQNVVLAFYYFAFTGG